ncbi:MAG: hypothetical protein C4K58_02375 [Flavobacteriaceae bacterium]|nr:MAG: hypothetical protein C4K58_02375 [Flavobacteriaceae bacterium]
MFNRLILKPTTTFLFFKKYLFFVLITFFVCSCKKDSGSFISKGSEKSFDFGSYTPKEFKVGTLDAQRKANLQGQLETYYKDFWQAGGLWGGILVAHKGNILLEKYSGFSSKETQKLIDNQTPIHLASVSKVITATIMLKLIQSGDANLEDKVIKYLPGFPYPKVTLKMLLNHRSGLPNYLYFSSDEEYWDKSKMLSNKDILSLMIRHKIAPEFEADSRFAYSNTNYAMLALVIEKITGTSFPKVLQEMIAKPLGMKNTFVFQMSDTLKASQSHYYRGGKYPFDYLDNIYGDKNIYSTPRDMLAFDYALYDDKFLSKELKELAYKGYSYERDGVKNYGLGMRIMEWENKKKLTYHNGWWHGNNTVFVHLPEDSTTIIALGNKYTRAVYSAMNLVSLFGEYPLEMVQREKAEKQAALEDSLRQIEIKDSLEKDSLLRLDSLKLKEKTLEKPKK